jgi:DNA-binding IclR family transcriptional regulator
LIVVIARIEAPGPFSFTVRVGHRQLLSRSTSGLVLFTGQPSDTQKAWLAQMAETDPAFEETVFLEQAKLAKERGFVEKRSRFIHGVTDIGAPIIRNGIAVASLTSSCVTRIDQAEGTDALPISILLETAQQITDDLPASSNE